MNKTDSTTISSQASPAIGTVVKRLKSTLGTLTRPFFLASSLVLLSMSVLLSADAFGLRERADDVSRESRKIIVQALAIQLSTFATAGDRSGIQRSVSDFVLGHPDVRGASLTLANGVVLARLGEPDALEDFEAASTSTKLRVPIYSGSELWGEVLVEFLPRFTLLKDITWLAFVALSSLLLFTVFLNRALVQLDPGRAVPGRVDSAMNLFSAGVIILDARLRIVMANKSAADIAGVDANELTGRTLDEWAWQRDQQWQAPWRTTLHSGLAVSDDPIVLVSSDGKKRSFLISCAFVGDSDSGRRGVLVTLDDMTTVERQNRELTVMLGQLRESQAVINAKNEELEILATTDPLTGIANRRTLMERLDKRLISARSDSTQIACVMTDIDHFKMVNDTYGHAVGDQVIIAVSNVLKELTEGVGFVGRYGGEEFVMVLPGLSAQLAADIAERARSGVMALASSDAVAVSSLSSSFGIADMSCEPVDAPGMIDAADIALYQAKESGRNRVVLYGADMMVPAEPQPAQLHAPLTADNHIKRIAELEALLRQRDHELDVLREFDPLTGVPLRTLFLQRAESELSRAAREGALVGVLSFSLRELERIVSTFGHARSDALVMSVIERIQSGLRATDLVSVISGEHSLSRITSNEYGVLLASLQDTTGAMVVVTRFKRLLSEPFLLEGEKVYVGANIGIALSAGSQASAANLFSDASEARNAAALKADKVAHVFASSMLHEASDDYIRLESDLHDALERGTIETWYQPKFDLEKRTVTGMEALLRWRHETRGFISPQLFVAVAEANGLIGDLSSLVLKDTLKQIKIWRSMGFDDLRVSINVSPMQLRAETLVSDTLQALEDAGVEGSRLEIELTETSVLDNPEQAHQALVKLRRAGVGISIDDFGTGYTSLSLIAELPLDVVKIDRLFINAVETSARSRAVVGSVISMAHALDLRVVGEGVETNEQLEIMSQLGCDEVQGYLISHPLPPEDITSFLVHQRKKDSARRA